MISIGKTKEIGSLIPSLYAVSTGELQKVWEAVGLSVILVSTVFIWCARTGRT